MFTFEMLRELFRQIEATLEVEYSCDDVFSHMGQFAELCLSGQEAAHVMPLVQHHIDLCADCREEIKALLEVLRGMQN